MRVLRARYAFVEHEALVVGPSKGAGDPTNADAREAEPAEDKVIGEEHDRVVLKDGGQVTELLSRKNESFSRGAISTPPSKSNILPIARYHAL